MKASVTSKVPKNRNWNDTSLLVTSSNFDMVNQDLGHAPCEMIKVNISSDKLSSIVTKCNSGIEVTDPFQAGFNHTLKTFLFGAILYRKEFPGGAVTPFKLQSAGLLAEDAQHGMWENDDRGGFAVTVMALEECDEFELVGIAADGEEAILMVNELQPDT